MIINFISQYGYFFWFILGIIFVLLEIKIGFATIYFFFSGLAAISVGFMLAFDVLDPNNFIGQFIVFFVALISISALLWKPLKSFMQSYSPKDQYSNIIGQSGYVINKALKKNKKGEITWSGTNVFAKIHTSEERSEIAIDEEVEIVEIVDNVFLVKSKSNQ